MNVLQSGFFCPTYNLLTVWIIFQDELLIWIKKSESTNFEPSPFASMSPMNSSESALRGVFRAVNMSSKCEFIFFKFSNKLSSSSAIMSANALGFSTTVSASSVASLESSLSSSSVSIEASEISVRSDISEDASSSDSSSASFCLISASFCLISATSK